MSETPPSAPQIDATRPAAKGLRTSLTGEVRVAAFNGPLEMLLHLVRTEEIDVTTLPIAEIARQYNEDLALAGGRVEPEAAGEHLVGMASLVHVKSRRLLPPDPAGAVSGPQALPEELAQFERAARAEALRGAMEILQEREAVMELVYFRPAAAVAEYAGEESIDADLFALLRAFRDILRRVGSQETASLSRERLTLVERIHWLMETMQRERRVHFRSLFSGLVGRVACILTFLALLEVIRLRLVRAHTSHHREDILIVLADDALPVAAEPGRSDA